MTLSRRNIRTGLGAGALAIGTAAAAERLRPTPQETLGPYFPVHAPAEHDFDLTRVAGRPGPAAGQIMELSGRVLRMDGSPVKGATMEIWQANAAGRYAHPMDKNSAPLDPNFQGEALNDKDILMSTMSARHRDPAATICKPVESREPGVLKFEWDIVLLQA